MVKQFRCNQAKSPSAIHLLWCGPNQQSLTGAFQSAGFDKIPFDSFRWVENPDDVSSMLKKHPEINSVYLNLSPVQFNQAAKSLSKIIQKANVMVVAPAYKLAGIPISTKLACQIIEHYFVVPEVGLRELPELLENALAGKSRQRH